MTVTLSTGTIAVHFSKHFLTGRRFLYNKFLSKF